MVSDSPRISIVITTYNRPQKLHDTVESIYCSDYSSELLEVIVVDDANTIDESLFDDIPGPVKLITNENERLLSGCRNIGLNSASSKFIFLMDDDNIVAKSCLSKLVELLQTEKDIGVAGPFMYYYSDPDRLWCGGIYRNYWTSSTEYIQNNTLSAPIDVDDIPNAFMVRASVADAVDGFDERYFPIEHEHADFCERVRDQGYRVVAHPKAVIYHDIPLNDTTKFTNEDKTFYLARNRILFERRHADFRELLVFLLLIPAVTLYYLTMIIRHSDEPRQMIQKFIEGTIAGITTPLKRDL